jgi:hypothetical protein
MDNRWVFAVTAFVVCTGGLGPAYLAHFVGRLVKYLFY